MIELKGKRILSFFAHPDDETLAAGGTFAKCKSLGCEVHVAIPSTGINSRSNVQVKTKREKALEGLRKDCYTAMKVLGIPAKRVYLGDFADNELDKYSRLELIHWLESIIRKVKPDIVFTNHRFCTNIDHQYCHEAAVIATRPALGYHTILISGEVPSSTGHLRPANWEPNFYVELSKKEVEAKVKAMQAYKSEVRPDPHGRSPEALRALAKVRGSESGFFWAESFMINRIFHE